MAKNRLRGYLETNGVHGNRGAEPSRLAQTVRLHGSILEVPGECLSELKNMGQRYNWYYKPIK